MLECAASIARHSGSRLILLRIIEEGVDDGMILNLERTAEKITAPLDVPMEAMELRLVGKEHSPSTMVSSLREAVKRTNPDWIVLPVDKGVFEGKRSSLRMVRWTEDLESKKVVLVSNWETKPMEGVFPRVLIPVLGEFKSEPFEVAEALTGGANVPDVNVVAAKVVEIPSIVPLYSIYKPSSLVDADRELATYASLPKWAIIRRIKPMVLLVRSAGRDLVQFANERSVDIIIFEGDWNLRSHGYLGRKEQRTAIDCQCAVIVTFPKKGQSI
jgi:hypothetical protein